MKKIISLALATVMLGGIACPAVGAEETQEKTYRYVALGDSIAAGFGLENESGSFLGDPSVFLTEDLIANPIRSAYPALYGEKLTALGEDNGYEMIATNLSTCGYLAEDVEKTILEDNHKGAMMQSILRMTGNTENDPMEHYHEIFSQYIPDADLVSIQLGGNDIILSMFRTVGKSDNPIVEAVRTSVMMTLLGTDLQTAMQTAMQKIQSERDKINYKTVIEAANALKTVVDATDESVDKAAQDVGSIIDTVRTINEDADFAIVNMYNPFGNSLELNGKMQNIRTIVCDIITGSAEYISGLDKNADRDTVVAGLKQIVKDKMTYPLQYLFAGKTIDKTIKQLNSSLKEVAESKGAIYVDVYEISNESNFDPHPTAQGHKEIADKLYEATYKTVAEKLGIEVEEGISGDADGDGKVSILDVTCIQKMLAEIFDRDSSSFSGRFLTAIEKKIFDVDGDGKVTIQDATAIQFRLADLRP